MGNILTEQIHACNREFGKFVDKNYCNWVSSPDRTSLAVDVVPKFVIPNLRQDKKVCLIVVDALRHDQFLTILPEIGQFFNIEIVYHMA